MRSDERVIFQGLGPRYLFPWKRRHPAAFALWSYPPERRSPARDLTGRSAGRMRSGLQERTARKPIRSITRFSLLAFEVIGEEWSSQPRRYRAGWLFAFPISVSRRNASRQGFYLDEDE